MGPPTGAGGDGGGSDPMGGGGAGSWWCWWERQPLEAACAVLVSFIGTYPAPLNRFPEFRFFFFGLFGPLGHLPMQCGTPPQHESTLLVKSQVQPWGTGFVT